MDIQLLEKQYMVTQQDKRLINMFLNKNPSQKKDLESDMFTDYIEMPKEKKELTEWHNITFFGKLVDVVEKYLKKGYGSMKTTSTRLCK